MTNPLKLSMVFTADAASVKAATAETRKEVAAIGVEANSTESKMQRLVATARGINIGMPNADPGLAVSRIGATADEAAAKMRRLQGEIANVDKANAKLASQKAAGVNAAYQIQDTITSAIGGAPIGMIVGQQGFQLAGAIQQMERPVAGLAAAFTSLLNPVTLVSIGLTAGAAALAQYFSGIEWGGAKSEATLVREAELVANVSKRWGETLPALKAYNDERQKLETDKETGAALAVAKSAQWDELRAKVAEVNIAMTDTQSQIGQSGGDEQLRTLSSAYNDLRDKINAGTASAADAKRVYDVLMASFGETGVPAAAGLAKEFLELAASIDKAATKAAGFDVDSIAMRMQRYPSRGTYRGVERSADGPIITSGLVLPETGPLIQRRPKIELEGLPGDKREESIYARAIENAREQVEQMRLQAKTIGEAGVAADALRFRLSLLQRATIDGKDATADQVREIDKLTSAYREAAEASAAGRMLSDQQRNLETLRAELSLVSATEVQRRSSLALLQAEQQLRDRGISTSGEAADRYRRQALEISNVNAQIARQAEAWNMVKRTGEGVIDNVFNKLADGEFDLGSILEDSAKSITKLLFEMSASQPLRTSL